MEENKIKILLVEDDKNLGSLLCEFLNAKNYDAELAKDGKDGFEKYSNGNYDICILDVMMPIMDGFTLARKIRSVDLQIPIIFLTAKSMKEDTIEGFESGGDDYISKPFSMEELLYRIRAIIKRAKGGDDGDEILIYKVGQYNFDPNSQLMESKGKNYKLTSKESALLKVLCQNRNQTVQREVALKLIWGDDTYFNARSMDVYISKLRKHFKSDPEVEIVNIHGKGFKLVIRNNN